MGWSIHTTINTVKVPEEYRDRLEEIADQNGHVIGFSDEGTIHFDDDAMEHMDFVDEPWAKQIFSEAKVDGLIVFGSAEGDNVGDYWGYSFAGGMSAGMSKAACLLEMANAAARAEAQAAADEAAAASADITD